MSAQSTDDQGRGSLTSAHTSKCAGTCNVTNCFAQADAWNRRLTHIRARIRLRPRTGNRTHDHIRDHGSASIWTVALIGLIAAMTSAILLLASAIGSRHAVERAADAAALTAARAAMSGLRLAGDPQAGTPCAAATHFLAESGSHLTLQKCGCDVLDCAVTVEGSFLQGTGVMSVLGARVPILAQAQAGPVGEAGQDEGVFLPIDDYAPG